MATKNKRFRTAEEITEFLDDLESDFDEETSSDDSYESENGKRHFFSEMIAAFLFL